MDAARFQKELDLAQMDADIMQLKQEISLLESEGHELSSLQPGRSVYMKQANIFFLADLGRTKSSKKLDSHTKKQQLQQLTSQQTKIQTELHK